MKCVYAGRWTDKKFFREDVSQAISTNSTLLFPHLGNYRSKPRKKENYSQLLSRKQSETNSHTRKYLIM
jgi:hypothetical protein